MIEKKISINRREFIKGVSLGGLTILHGCSKKKSSPTGPDNDDPTSLFPTTKVALYKTQDRKEGVKKVMEFLEFAPIEGKHVVLKPNFNTAGSPPASTHNDTLSQLVLELHDRGASEITLAERSFQAW